MKMQVGMVGLGRMGANMARRLIKGGHDVIVYNRTREKADQIQREGATDSVSLEDLVKKLTLPRVIWMMLPAGDVVDQHINTFSQLLSSGDILIDGGNSFYRDDLKHAEMLKLRGIYFLDAGVSGGIWGLEKGYCIMIGGEEKIFKHLEPILKTLSPKDGYMFCGPTGAGHFVKMVHNGIEYAMMEAYGEGFNIIKSSPYEAHIPLDKLSHLWNQGSVVRSWLLELLESAFKKDPGLDNLKAYVEDSGEGRWTVQQAIETGTPAPVIALSLFQRFQSRIDNSFSNRVIAALRQEFGGHSVLEATNEKTEK
jgi:6-phosphogluconate dehydrogenase